MYYLHTCSNFDTGRYNINSNCFYFKSHSVVSFIKYAFPVCECSLDVYGCGGWWLWCAMMSSFNAFNLHDELPHVVHHHQHHRHDFFHDFIITVIIVVVCVVYRFIFLPNYTSTYACMWSAPHAHICNEINFETAHFHWISV